MIFVHADGFPVSTRAHALASCRSSRRLVPARRIVDSRSSTRPGLRQRSETGSTTPVDYPHGGWRNTLLRLRQCSEAGSTTSAHYPHPLRTTLCTRLHLDGHPTSAPSTRTLNPHPPMHAPAPQRTSSLRTINLYPSAPSLPPHLPMLASGWMNMFDDTQ